MVEHCVLKKFTASFCDTFCISPELKFSDMFIQRNHCMTNINARKKLQRQGYTTECLTFLTSHLVGSFNVVIWPSVLQHKERSVKELPGIHPSGEMSWSESRCESAHKKQLWTRRWVWLFLHTDTPPVWHRGWICTAPGVEPFKTGILTYKNIWRILKMLTFRSDRTISVSEVGWQVAGLGLCKPKRLSSWVFWWNACSFGSVDTQ